MTSPLERARDAILRVQNPKVDFDREPTGDLELHAEVHRSLHELGKTESIARAVLEAIREPSEGMCVAGGENIVHSDGQTEPDTDAAKSVWQAMIDAALSEGG